jgi:hypothetical protein
VRIARRPAAVAAKSTALPTPAASGSDSHIEVPREWHPNSAAAPAPKKSKALPSPSELPRVEAPDLVGEPENS